MNRQTDRDEREREKERERDNIYIYICSCVFVSAVLGGGAHAGSSSLELPGRVWSYT